MKRLYRHMHRLWPRYLLLPVLPLALWTGWMATQRMLRWDHLAVLGLVAGLAYYSPATKRFLTAFGSFIAVGFLYDASRFVRDLGVNPGRVALCGLHDLEAAIFGVTVSGQRMTLQDFFLHHHLPSADYLFAFPYATFIGVSILYAIYLFATDEAACRRFCWGFFVLNVAGMITYHLLPAAPPWYFHKYGCVADLSLPSYEGWALARVDAALSLPYFRGFYGRASEVFGAFPSLHVAYPLLIVLEGWRRHRWLGRGLAIFYWLLMCGAAVYLDHHWVLDVVAGWAYAAVTFVAMRKVVPDAKPPTEAVMSPSVAGLSREG